MKDHRGIYYYPFPQNKRVKMYVRRFGDDIEFRLWNQDDTDLWEEHGWVSYDAVVLAANRFDKTKFNPDQAYDIEVARAILREDRQPV
jgi:hypothetical protein